MEPCCSDSKKPQPQPTFLTRILNKVFVTEAEKNRRMTICKSCDHLNKTFKQCKICGCFMEAKTSLHGFHCALDEIGEEPKW